MGPPFNLHGRPVYTIRCIRVSPSVEFEIVIKNVQKTTVDRKKKKTARHLSAASKHARTVKTKRKNVSRK